MRWGIKPLRVALLTIFVALLTLPASALAAAPPNDDFADREVLPSGFPMGLPIEVTGSNVEATKEDGEFIQQLAPAGHSIWFEWEATATEWVSVGLCGTEFPTILDIFTGTEIDELTSLTHTNGSAGPDCSGGNRVKYTFKATSGTKYAIVVDGNAYTGPEVVPVQTEGEVFLQIEETQPPANDDFVDAEPLTGRIDEEPGGHRVFFASARGNNWTATTELEEPSYGPGAGASVWYEWTVPVDGTYSIGPCCGPGLRWALFNGEAIDDLTQLFLGPGSAQMALVAGTSLKLAVFGPADAGTGEPAMGSFDIFVKAELPPLPKPSPGGGDATQSPASPVAPETKITQRTLRHRIGFARFRFGSTVAGSSFQCKLDKAAFGPCASPKTYRNLKPGRHTLRVRAISPAGPTDSTAAVARFLIAQPQRPR